MVDMTAAFCKISAVRPKRHQQQQEEDNNKMSNASLQVYYGRQRT
jgi:hypothetical protein